MRAEMRHVVIAALVLQSFQSSEAPESLLASQPSPSVDVLLWRGFATGSYIPNPDYQSDLRSAFAGRTIQFESCPSRERVLGLLAGPGVVYANVHSGWLKNRAPARHAVQVGERPSGNGGDETSFVVTANDLLAVRNSVGETRMPKLFVLAGCSSLDPAPSGELAIPAALGYAPSARGRAFIGFTGTVPGFRCDSYFRAFLAAWAEREPDGTYPTLERARERATRSIKERTAPFASDPRDAAIGDRLSILGDGSLRYSDVFPVESAKPAGVEPPSQKVAHEDDVWVLVDGFPKDNPTNHKLSWKTDPDRDGRYPENTFLRSVHLSASSVGVHLQQKRRDQLEYDWRFSFAVTFEPPRVLRSGEAFEASVSGRVAGGQKRDYLISATVWLDAEGLERTRKCTNPKAANADPSVGRMVPGHREGELLESADTAYTFAVAGRPSTIKLQMHLDNCACLREWRWERRKSHEVGQRATPEERRPRAPDAGRARQTPASRTHSHGELVDALDIFLIEPLFVAGVIHAENESGLKSPLDPRKPIVPGTRILTSPGSELMLRFGDGSIAQTRGATTVLVPRSDVDAQGSRIRVESGTAAISIRREDPKLAPLTAETPDVRIDADGTEYEVTVDPSGSFVRVTEGQIRLSGASMFRCNESRVPTGSPSTTLVLAEDACACAPRSRAPAASCALREGFESGLAMPWGTGHHSRAGAAWWNSGPCKSTVSVDERVRHEGLRSLRIVNSTPRSPHVFGTCQRQVKLVANRKYRVTLWARASNVASHGAVSIVVDDAWKVRPVQLPQGTWDWTRFEGEFVPASSAATVRILAEDRAEVWIDDLVIE
jgi:ferric-dicitrate binding protein FerR (iron transport regulator)